MINIPESEKKRLFSLFENMKGETVTTELNRRANNNILLVDGL